MRNTTRTKLYKLYMSLILLLFSFIFSLQLIIIFIRFFSTNIYYINSRIITNQLIQKLSCLFFKVFYVGLFRKKSVWIYKLFNFTFCLCSYMLVCLCSCLSCNNECSVRFKFRILWFTTFLSFEFEYKNLVKQNLI